MIEIKAPNQISTVQLLTFNIKSFTPTIFMAGSIEMGVADNWQTRFAQAFNDTDVVLYNPRRDDWDSTWKQSIDDPQFNEQVNWELDHLVRSDLAVFYFDPGTKSPITLMELGFIIGSQHYSKTVVCCPEGYWRRGNVEVMCNRFYVPMVNDLDGLVEATKQALGKL
jgi:Nucleoside 2-deoxyribosyltransferase like